MTTTAIRRVPVDRIVTGAVLTLFFGVLLLIVAACIVIRETVKGVLEGFAQAADLVTEGFDVMCEPEGE